MEEGLNISDLSHSIRDEDVFEENAQFSLPPVQEIPSTPPTPTRGRGRPRKNSLPHDIEEQPKRQPLKKKEKEEKPNIVILKFKIKCFLNSKYLGHKFSDEVRNLPEFTLEECQEKLDTIKRCVKFAFKKEATQQLFYSFVGLTESFSKPWLPYMEHFSDEIENSPELFEPCLEEIAIDMDDKYVPGPYGRLLAGLVIVMNKRRKEYELLQHTNYKPEKEQPKKSNPRLKSILKSNVSDFESDDNA